MEQCVCLKRRDAKAYRKNKSFKSKNEIFNKKTDFDTEAESYKQSGGWSEANLENTHV